MRKRLGFWVLVAIFAILLPGSMALAGGKGSVQSRGGGKGGGKITGRSAPSAKRISVRSRSVSKERKTYFKSGSKKKNSSVPPSLGKEKTIALALQKTRLCRPTDSLTG